MVSRLLGLILAVPATVLGIVFAMLATEEISKETREVRACVHDVHRETRKRANSRIPLRPTYMVIETDRSPQKFVHYLGSLWGDDELAKRIRRGDCVRITVDEAAEDDGKQLESANANAVKVLLAKRALKSFALGWPLVPSITRPWVRIQRLERGREELISPRDALFWPLAVLGGFSLLFLGIATHQLHRVVFGAPAH